MFFRCIAVWKCPECGKAFKVDFSELHKMQEVKKQRLGHSECVIFSIKFRVHNFLIGYPQKRHSLTSFGISFPHSGHFIRLLLWIDVKNAERI